MGFSGGLTPTMKWTHSGLFPEFSWELVGSGGSVVQELVHGAAIRNTMVKQSSSTALLLSNL